MAGQDVEIDQHLGKRLRLHRRAAILVQRQLPRLNALLGAGVGNQALGQRGAHPGGDHPGHHVMSHVHTSLGALAINRGGSRRG